MAPHLPEPKKVPSHMELSLHTLLFDAGVQVHSKAGPWLPPQRLQLPDCRSQTPSTSASSTPRGVQALPAPPVSCRPPPGLQHPLAGIAPLHLPVGAPAPASEPSSWPTVCPEAHTEAAAVAELPPGRRVRWEIRNIASKLRATSGYPLVSHALQLGPLTDLRLQFVPGELWVSDMMDAKKRRAKSDYCASRGLPHGGIRLKSCEAETCHLRLTVKPLLQVDMECNFLEKPMPQCAFDRDWRQHLQGEGDCLVVCVELL